MVSEKMALRSYKVGVFSEQPKIAIWAQEVLFYLYTFSRHFANNLQTEFPCLEGVYVCFAILITEKKRERGEKQEMGGSGSAAQTPELQTPALGFSDGVGQVDVQCACLFIQVRTSLAGSHYSHCTYMQLKAPWAAWYANIMHRPWILHVQLELGVHPALQTLIEFYKFYGLYLELQTTCVSCFPIVPSHLKSFLSIKIWFPIIKGLDCRKFREWICETSKHSTDPFIPQNTPSLSVSQSVIQYAMHSIDDCIPETPSKDSLPDLCLALYCDDLTSEMSSEWSWST